MRRKSDDAVPFAMRCFRGLRTAVVFMSAGPCLFAEGHSAADSANQEAETHQKLSGDGFGYAEVLQKALFFFDAQRSGDLPNDFRVAWRGDSALDDGKDAGIDLTGGYYDAGDHMKFALPLASALTLLAWGGIEYRRGYERAGQWSHLLDTIRWGTDWIMKAHVSKDVFYAQVGDPGRITRSGGHPKP